MSDMQKSCRVRDLTPQEAGRVDWGMALGTLSWVSFAGVTWGSILYLVRQLL